MPGDDELSFEATRIGRGDDGFERLASKALAKMFTPGDIEAAIGWLEIRNVHACFPQALHPLTRRAKPRPACATESKQNCIRLDFDLPIGRIEKKRAVPQPNPVMAHLDRNAPLCEAAEPRPQQRRAFHRLRKDTAGGSDESLLPQPLRPIAQHLRGKRVQRAFKAGF